MHDNNSNLIKHPEPSYSANDDDYPILFEPLEPRVLLSGTGIGAVADIGANDNLFTVDLSAAIINPKLPSSVVSGDGSKIGLPIMVTNEGNIPLDNKQKIDIDILAQPVNGGDAVLIGTHKNQSISDLKPGASKKITANIYLPAGLATGQYVLVAKVDSSNVVDESNEANNTAMTSAATPIDVTLGEIDLIGEFGKITLPSALVVGQGVKSKVQVEVTNDGNVPIAKNQKIDIQILFRPIAGGDDILLATTTNQSISVLKPGKTKNISVSVAIPDDLPAGEYKLVSKIDSTDAVVNERYEDNNEVVSDDIYICADPFVDLTAEIVNPKLPDSVVSGDGTRIKLPIEVTNQGNVPIGKNNKIDLMIYTRPLDAIDDTQDVEVTLLENVSISNLKPGAGKKITANVYLPAGLDTDQYRLVVEVDCSDDIAESNEDNNTAQTSDDNPIDVELGEIDLIGEFGKATLPPAIVAGQGAKGKVPVLVTNDGNVVVAKGQKIDLQILFRPTGGGEDLMFPTVSNQSISGLKPGKSKSINVAVILPDDLPAGEYQLVTVVDSSDAVTNERHEGNNEIVSGDVYTCADPFVDLTAEIVNPKLPNDTVVSGDGTKIKVPVEVTNRGNVPIDKNQKIDLMVCARPSGAIDDSQDVEVILLENQSISNLKPGASKKITASVTLPAGITTGEYVLVAEVDSSSAVAESNEDNNTATTDDVTPINVELGFLAINAEVSQKMKLPNLLLAGDGTRLSMPLTLTNNGNVSTDSKCTVDVVVVARQTGGDPANDIEIQTYEDVKMGSIKPGQSKNLTLNNIINDVPGIDGDYELVARITPDFISETPIIEAPGPSIEFVGSFMELTLLNISGVTRQYEASLSGSAEGILVGGNGTLTSNISWLGNDYYQLSNSSGNHEDVYYIWGDKPQGTVLSELSYETNDSFVDAAIDMAFSELLVGPASLVIGVMYTDTSQGSLDIDIYDLGISVQYDLDVKVNTKLTGYDTITVPYGTFDVAKINMIFTYNGHGFIEGRSSTFKMTESLDLYTSPDVGIVKYKDKASVKISVSGAGSASGSGTATYVLESVTGLSL